MRVACLEDFTQSEQSFYSSWARVLDFLSLDLPRGASTWQDALPDLISQENPLAAGAKDTVKSHGSISRGDERAALVANYSQRVLRIDRSLNGGTGRSLLKLSAALQCYDWTGERGAPRDRARRPSWQL